MAKENQDSDQRSPEVLEESLNKTEVLLEENKDLISKILLVIVIVIGGYFVYNNWFVEPAEQAAFDEIWPAQKLFEQDSVQKAITEFEYLSEEHGGTKAGNLSNLYLGIALLQDGKYEEALEALETFDASGKLTPGLKVGLIGDCYSEMNNFNEAVDNYKKAASLLNSKSGSTYFLKKAGLLLEQNSDLQGAVAVYELAMSKYLNEAGPSIESVKNEMQVLLSRVQTATK
jgi:predicted negative regulator of RcsB-dependent stress response